MGGPSDQTTAFVFTVGLAAIFAILSVAGRLMRERLNQQAQRVRGYRDNNQAMLKRDGADLERSLSWIIPQFLSPKFKHMMARSLFEVSLKNDTRKLNRLAPIILLFQFLNFITTVGAIAVVVEAAFAYVQSEFDRSFKFDVAGLVLVIIKAILVALIQEVGNRAIKRRSAH